MRHTVAAFQCFTTEQTNPGKYGVHNGHDKPATRIAMASVNATAIQWYVDSSGKHQSSALCSPLPAARPLYVPRETSLPHSLATCGARSTKSEGGTACTSSCREDAPARRLTPPTYAHTAQPQPHTQTHTHTNTRILHASAQHTMLSIGSAVSQRTRQHSVFSAHPAGPLTAEPEKPTFVAFAQARSKRSY